MCHPNSQVVNFVFLNIELYFSIKYIAPAKYDDVIQIQTVVSEIKNSQIIFTYSIHLREKLIATADTELVFVSAINYKPIRMPKSFEFLKQKVN